MRTNILIFALIVFALGAAFVFFAGRGNFLKTKNDATKAEQNSNQDVNIGNFQKDFPDKMTISSPIFYHNGGLPISATCDSKGVNPPLEIGGTPKDAKSLVLIVSDPDAPNGTFFHWVLWNIDPSTRIIKENSVPDGAIQGMNSDQRVSYVAACPPSGTHHYIFNIYALDEVLDLPPSTTAPELEHAIEDHVLDNAHITGLYR